MTGTLRIELLNRLCDTLGAGSAAHGGKQARHQDDGWIYGSGSQRALERKHDGTSRTPLKSTLGSRMCLRIGMALLVLCLLALPSQAYALPSYTRQTQQPCTACHLGGNYPELTPFGRAFKLGGYTLSAGGEWIPPVSAVVQTGFTHTETSQSPSAAQHFGPNDNFSLEFASIYLAGKIFDDFGAFSQWTYDGIGHVFTIDHTDIRYANTGSIGDSDIVFGVTLNDAPTVEDIYNTTTAFGPPFTRPGLGPMPAAKTLIDTLPFEVGGAGAYAMLANTAYGVVTLYHTWPHDFQRSLGVKTAGEPEIDNVAPYWRLAFQHEWDQHSLSVGTIGMWSKTFPDRDHSAGTDEFTDFGLDAQYQFNGDPHTASFQASFIHEDQRLGASQALGFSANSSNTLDTIKLKGSYFYQNTYGVSLSGFWITGTQDTGLFAPAPITGSANGKPDSNGWTVELDWLPFMQSRPEFLPEWAQVKLSLQYTAYNKFNGGTDNYDGFGRHAYGNNTVFLNAWFAF